MITVHKLQTLRSFLLFSIILTALLLPATSSAKIKLGECNMYNGKCYHDIKIVLTDEDVQELRKQPPVENQASIRYNLKTQKTRTVPVSDEFLANHVVPREIIENQSENFAIDNNKALGRVSHPWTHEPLHMAVKLFMELQNGMAACSGTMVGRHTVFTAGHCLRLNEYGGWVKSVTVVPAMDGVDYTHGMEYITPYGTAEGVDIAVSQAWADSEDFRYDTGVIQLNKNIGDITGIMDVEIGGGNYSGTINFAGYPGADNYTGMYLYKNAGQILTSYSDSYNICHSSVMIEGMSGGPAWVYYSATSKHYLVAANSFGTNGGIYCHARFNSANGQTRLEFEAETAGDATDYWTCDVENYTVGDGCQCNCGIWDFDCESGAYNADHCNDGKTCRYPGTCDCTPDCSGRECGDNGCGGSCGECTDSSKSWCNNNGTCAVPDCDVICDWRECGTRDGCDCGDCGGDTPYCSDYLCQAKDCDVICDWRECGTYDGCECGSCSGSTPNCESNICRSDSMECTGNCTNGDPGFCTSEHSLCACYYGDYYNISCQEICEEGGYFASGGCDLDSGSNNYVCYCSYACTGYTGTDTCCAASNPCNLEDDDLCQCEGKCSWDRNDCPSGEDGDETPVDGDQTPVDGDTTNPNATCDGSCLAGAAPFCVDNDQNICICNNFVWETNSCVGICKKKGMDFDTCAPHPVENKDYCVCVESQADGDETVTPDGDENILPDGDDNGSGGSSGDGGCNQSQSPALLLLLLAFAALLPRRLKIK